MVPWTNSKAETKGRAHSSSLFPAVYQEGSMFNHFSLRAARNSLMTVLVLSTRDELQHHRVQSEISLSEGKITRGRNLGWDTRLSRRPCQARKTGAQELHTLPQEIMQLFFFWPLPVFTTLHSQSWPTAISFLVFHVPSPYWSDESRWMTQSWLWPRQYEATASSQRATGCEPWDEPQTLS